MNYEMNERTEIQKDKFSMSHKIMIVDDESANLRLLARLFRREHQVVTAESGAEALALLEQHEIALLITDQRMPGMTGIELLKRVAVARPNTVRIILTGYTDTQSLVEAINCGQVYRFITKPWNNDDLRATVARALEHYEVTRRNFELARINERLAQNLRDMTHAFVRAIGDALDAKDDYAHGHARRTQGYALAIGRRMNLDDDALEQLSLAAFLHDIGRIGTPDALLLKPGELNHEERFIMQQHSERGARLLAGVPNMHDIAVTVRHHHEHFDGSGYPAGLRGHQIPQLSRIILVADAYDALTCPRPFREEAHDHESAVRILKDAANTIFDPEAVRAFCELDRLAAIRQRIFQADFGSTHAARDNFDFTIATFDDLQHEVFSDPLLAADVLRIANEKLLNETLAGETYDSEHQADNSQDAPTADLAVACARLKLEGLRQTIANRTARQLDCLHRKDETSLPSDDALDHDAFREHSLRCAATARLLAEHTGIIAPAAAYTLGLLHDIGEALLCETFPNEMKNLLHLDTDARICREVEFFGVDHAQIGEWILERCGVTRPLAALVQTHHDVMRTGAPAALLLHVAACLAHVGDTQKVSTLDALGSDRLALLGLNRAVVATIYARTTSAVKEQLAAYSLGNS